MCVCVCVSGEWGRARGLSGDTMTSISAGQNHIDLTSKGAGGQSGDRTHDLLESTRVKKKKKERRGGGGGGDHRHQRLPKASVFHLSIWLTTVNYCIQHHGERMDTKIMYEVGNSSMALARDFRSHGMLDCASRIKRIACSICLLDGGGV